jgi:hypothetical protein
MNYMVFKPGGDQCVGEAKAGGYQWISLEEAGSKTRDRSFLSGLGTGPQAYLQNEIIRP